MILIFVFSLGISTIIFLLIMALFRYLNFHKKGSRKSNWRELTPELRSSEIQYHNEAVYKAFEFYIKIVLAIFGAIGLASVTKEYNTDNIKLIIEYLGYTELGITILFCVIYLSHQKAKIERWERRFRWFEPLIWNECWLFSFSIALAITVNCSFIPKILTNL